VVAGDHFEGVVQPPRVLGLKVAGKPAQNRAEAHPGTPEGLRDAAELDARGAHDRAGLQSDGGPVADVDPAGGDPADRDVGASPAAGQDEGRRGDRERASCREGVREADVLAGREGARDAEELVLLRKEVERGLGIRSARVAQVGRDRG